MIHWSRYNDLAQTNFLKNQSKFEWRLEAGYGENNLGILEFQLGNFDQALFRYKNAIKLHEDTASMFSKKPVICNIAGLA